MCGKQKRNPLSRRKQTIRPFTGFIVAPPRPENFTFQQKIAFFFNQGRVAKNSQSVYRFMNYFLFQNSSDELSTSLSLSLSLSLALSLFLTHSQLTSLSPVPSISP